jgi:hypothetical protein
MVAGMQGHHSRREGMSTVGSRYRATYRQNRNCLTVTKIWSWAPDGGLTPGLTGRLTVGRTVTLTCKRCT